MLILNENRWAELASARLDLGLIYKTEASIFCSLECLLQQMFFNKHDYIFEVWSKATGTPDATRSCTYLAGESSAREGVASTTI